MPEEDRGSRKLVFKQIGVIRKQIGIGIFSCQYSFLKTGVELFQKCIPICFNRIRIFFFVICFKRNRIPDFNRIIRLKQITKQAGAELCQAQPLAIS